MAGIISPIIQLSKLRFSGSLICNDLGKAWASFTKQRLSKFPDFQGIFKIFFSYLPPSHPPNHIRKKENREIKEQVIPEVTRCSAFVIDN